jgi:hypothetical protein
MPQYTTLFSVLAARGTAAFMRQSRKKALLLFFA